MSPILRTVSVVLSACVLAACPKAPPASSPAAASPPSPKRTAPLDDAQVEKLATILRVADRRVLDESLTSLLADRDPLVRSRAAMALGQIGDPAGAAPLEARASDADASVRASVAFALGLVGVEGSRPVLETLSSDREPSVRASAVEALGRLHVAASTPRVAALLADADPGVRQAASLAAWKFSDPAPLVPGLLLALEGTEPRVRAAAAYALARMTSAPVAPASSGATVGRLSPDDLKKARAALAGHVGDEDVEVRRQVARGLASPEGAAEFAIVGTLSGDKDAIVRIQAIRSLGYPGVPVKPYLDRAMVDKDPSVARVALESVGKICTGPALGLLQDHKLDYEGSWLVEPLLVSMVKCDPTMLPEIVDGLLQNPDPVMRLAAAPLLVERREAGALRAAFALASDPDPRVQVAGIGFFADQDGPIGKLLASKLAAPDPVVRAAVVEAIGSRLERPRAGTESKETLLELLEGQWTAAEKDDLPDARLAVVEAASKVPGEARARALLERALGDPSVVVRRSAAERLLSAFGTDRRAEVGPSSDRPLAEYETIVRWSGVPRAAVVTVEHPNSLPARFSIRLDAVLAPLAAWNFAQLAEKRYFDGLYVHRVVPGFVVQDGDPRGDGFGGPGYTIQDEFNPTPFEAGTVGMASAGKDTAGSQWFVTLAMQPHLDGRYTAFGRVVQGQSGIVDQIRPGDRIVSIRIYEGDGSGALPTD